MSVVSRRRVSIVVGDIVEQQVDAVVNAANTAMRPGGGVDGAITRAAGASALADRERLIAERGTPPLPTGIAVVGSGGDLPARWIVYTAGPIYSGSPDEARLLGASYSACLAAAGEIGARSIAFPAISCGTYGYPLDEAAPIAITALLGTDAGPLDVRMVLIDEATAQVFRRALGART